MILHPVQNHFKTIGNIIKHLPPFSLGQNARVKVTSDHYTHTYLSIAVNISERKTGTERTKKRKKWELVYFFTARGRKWYCITSSRRYLDIARATITGRDPDPGLRSLPGPTRTESQLKVALSVRLT